MQTNDLPTLKKAQRVKSIQPDTTRDFGCIMSACEDNCCRNTTWTITVDPAAYKKYQALKNDVGERILSCIEGEEPNYKFKQFDDGKCPLMMDDGLCYIHKNLGETYLCNTCATYPRNSVWFNKNLEYWLSLSCPEVVRHVLYQKKSISFVEEVRSTYADLTTNPRDAEKVLVRDTLAKIISYRKLNLKEKMLYMGLFMRSIGKLNLYAPDYDRSFRKTIKNYSNGLKDARKTLSEAVTRLGEQPEKTRTSMFVAIASLTWRLAVPPKLHPEGIENAKYYTLMGNFCTNILNGSVMNYLVDTFDNKIVPYVNSKPHVFENYLMYVLMSSKFLSDSHDYAACYAGFAGEFVTMLTFACMFHEYESFGDEEMVVAMYLFHRRVSHNQKLRQALAKQFADNLLVFLVCALGGIK